MIYVGWMGELGEIWFLGNGLVCDCTEPIIPNASQEESEHTPVK